MHLVELCGFYVKTPITYISPYSHSAQYSGISFSTFTMLYNYHYFEDFVSNYLCMRGFVHMNTVNIVAGRGYQSLGAGIRSN